MEMVLVVASDRPNFSITRICEASRPPSKDQSGYNQIHESKSTHITRGLIFKGMIGGEQTELASFHSSQYNVARNTPFPIHTAIVVLDVRRSYQSRSFVIAVLRVTQFISCTAPGE